MSDVTVVTVQQRTPTVNEFYYFPEECMRSITRFGVQPIVLGKSSHWGGHGDKAKLLKAALDNNLVTTKYLIFTDSFDALFAVSPDEVLNTYLSMDTAPIIWGAEKYCFSDSSLAPALEQKWPSNTSYKYLNSGWAMGETEAFHEALTEMDPVKNIQDDYQKPDGSWHHDNDQVWWQKQMLNGTVPIGLDTEARLVWNMAGVEESGVDLSEERVKCVETGTYPCVLHMNGGAKNIWKDRLLAKLGIPGKEPEPERPGYIP